MRTNSQRQQSDLQPVEDSKDEIQIPPARPQSAFQLGTLLKNLSLMGLSSILLLTFVILADTWRSSTRFVDGIQSLLTVSESEPQVDVRTVVVQQIRGASELTTAFFAMEAVVPTSRDRLLGNYVIGKTTLLYIAYGEVRAGVDLAELAPEDVVVNGDFLELRLPPPRILDSKIDVTRSRVYDYDRGFMGLGPDVAPELQTLAQQETLNKIVATACSEGLLTEASIRAEVAVTQLLNTAGYQNFSVVTQPPALEACPTSSLSESLSGFGSPSPTGALN